MRNRKTAKRGPLVLAAIALGAPVAALAASGGAHDVVIRGGMIYDGSGAKPYVGDVAIDGKKITYVGPPRPMRAERTIDATGKAVAPGFINMLSGAQESLLVDGRAESDLFQGVTLEVMGEGDSIAPLNDSMAKLAQSREGDIKYPVNWRSLDQYYHVLEQKGISVNVASVVGAATARANVLGERDVQPTPEQLREMRRVVRSAMQDGAVALGSALIYAPGTFAKTPELKALAAEAGRCGGIYITHMRSEGDDLLGAVDETVSIAQASGAPAEIYHLKAAGQANWPKLEAAIGKIQAARASGVRITTNMYPYTAVATGFDASMPHWVLDGGLEAWIARMKEPAVRARLVRELQHPDFESALVAAGPEGTLLLGFNNEKLKPLAGKTLAEVAKLRGESPEETMIDLIIEDGSRVSVAYTLMSDDNVRREVALPFMSFGSDEAGEAPEGVFLKSIPHPRAYGTFARILARYVRDEKEITLQDAVHRMSGLPAANLSLRGRGLLKSGYFADIVVFEPDKIQDHATYENPRQLATGVDEVFVNGGLAFKDGEVTAVRSGQAVRGRGWTGWPDGGCRASAANWHWSW